MLSEAETTPTLDEPNLPEFCGATLSLNNASGTISNQKIVKQNLFSNNEADQMKERKKIAELQPCGPSSNCENVPLSPTVLSAEARGGDGQIISQGYFSSRNYMFAIENCKRILTRGEPENHGVFVGSWLLTMVDHWDNEKERLILLYSRTLFIVKYDFITTTLQSFETYALQKIIHLTIGNIEYPTHSITPKFQYLADSITGRFSSILRGNFNSQSASELLHKRSTGEETQTDFTSDRLKRNGVRILFGSVPAEPNFTQLWNPWSKAIPWLTFLSHPLLSTEHTTPAIFDVKDFTVNLQRTLQNEYQGLVEYKPIIMNSYLGLPALVHNYSQFGFYKVRGKVSF
ncbi:tumor protein p63-regulated gene 1-like protein [Daphnia pulex]|uniref:tumor protein p63-regulated gene 1-like protein n=1 Tax=Daphnia pulex TaxID=6669 RepID=UPI001EDF9076|nr:tumor protein p63-regulated gene 1-like protein [Daphnia pulex]XP_046654026.1 tumor protein p63-regulated gene 1-like protein [Daphnia pulicaria]